MPVDRITVPVGEKRDRDEGEEFARTVVDGTVDHVVSMEFVEFAGDEVTLKVSHTDERDAEAIVEDLGAREIKRTAI